MKKIILLLSVCSLIFTGTTAQNKLSKTDIASLYSESNFTEFSAIAYHSSDSITTTYINISLNDLYYRSHKTENKKLAKFKISYQLFESYISKILMDSASYIYFDSLNFGIETEMIINFDIKAKFPADYILQITVTDLYQNESNTASQFIIIHKSNRYSRQNFFITDSEGYPIFNQNISKNQYFKLHYNQLDKSEITIRYYNRSFPLAKPPFSTEKVVTYTFEPDSFYTINLNNGHSELLELQYHGLYHIQADIMQKEGLTLFHFDEGFPYVNTPVQAILPLRYLTIQKEYDKLLSYKNQKVAVDSFWLERSSYQEERARNMISRYYSRIEKANKLFSSYQEGWKTDRGLIYVIYGPPTEVYRNKEEERWIYGASGNPMSINFYFQKIENPFTDNAYSLNKSPLYKNSWYVAIENWRR